MNSGRAPQDYSVDQRLAVYGSLAPNATNAHILAPHAGLWVHGTVRGDLEPAGWGAGVGFPGIRLSDHGEEVRAWLFCSEQLPGLWAELDRFEGPGYRRTIARVAVAGGWVDAHIYELAP